jgi:periplasmic divalent cation tolerance protein
MTHVRLIYVTTQNTDQARGIARELLERKLIACANILPMMESIYRWNDAIQSEQEAVLILKTDARLESAATQAILELHSYETPCVLSLPVTHGAPDYLKWLLEQTK